MKLKKIIFRGVEVNSLKSDKNLKTYAPELSHKSIDFPEEPYIINLKLTLMKILRAQQLFGRAGVNR